MKIKNMKLMLLGLLAMGSMNAFAAEVVDEAARSVNGVVYKLVTDGTTKKATVLGVNSSATDAQMATIAIPATVDGEYGTYKVTTITAGWEKASGYKDVTAQTKTLSIDVTNLGEALADDAFSNFTILESLTITDGNAAKDAKTKSFKGGFSAGAKKTLKTVDFSGSNITTIADNAFLSCIALTGFDLAKVTEIGANAFDGCYGFTTLEIPATVEKIGAGAFANMYNETTKDGKTIYSGLTTLTFDANSTADKGFATFPDAFAGDKLLNSITLKSSKATGFDGNFTDAAKLETLTLDCPKVTSIAGIFAAAPFKTVDIEKTGLTKTDLDLSKAHQTLTTIKLPATLATLGTEFKNCVALTAIDLSGTAVTVIPDYAFQITGAEKDAKGKAIPSALTSVKLKATTTSIGISAFEGQAALETVEGMNQDKLASLGNRAFFGVGLKALDLSAATALTTIPTACFGDNKSLTTVKLSDKIVAINSAAFTHAAALTSINLENTKITTLKNIFTSGADDETAPCDALTSLTLPETLTDVEDYALQMTGLTEITIPASVTLWGDNVLQGCLNLKKFIWKDIDPAVTFIGSDTFLGDDKLEEVYFLAKTAWAGISDDDFAGNDPDRLKVYVNSETYAMLVANGWTPANTKYATLVGEAESDFEFKAAGKSGEYYYATYYNDGCATWFDANNFEVFSAIVDGSKVVLKPATVEGGYYKVAQFDPFMYPTYEDACRAGICVVRSKTQKAKVEYKYAGFNDISTLPSENGLRIMGADTKASRLKYQYKFGAKDGVVAFYRVTSGTIKEGSVYLDSADPKDRLDIVIEGEETAIQSIATEAENTGAIYNLNGIRVQKAGKGVYIQNGKKYVK